MRKPKHTYIHRICLSLLATGICSNVLAEELLFSLAATANHQELGSGFASLGDLNADGVVDVAVADRSARVATYLGSGIVHLVSGADGSLLRSYEGAPSPSQGFGSSLVALDADGDEIPDLAVGSPGQANANGYGAGAVRIYSGADGSLLSTVGGPSTSLFGASLANAGDQDGDGRDDLYVGAPNADGSRGAVFVLSSGTGAIVRTISTTASVGSFGASLVTLGDVDGDGLADVAVGSPGFRVGSNQAGRVVLARSSDGSTAAEVIGAGIYNRLGESLAPAADANGDGLPDLLVGSYSGGTARVVSGADLSVLADLSITLPLYRQLVVGGSLDFDLDGTADWLIGSPALKVVNGKAVGGIRVISGTDRSTLFEFTASVPNTGLGQTLKVLPGLGMAAGQVNLRDSVTGGYGLAHVWWVEEVRDIDGDGINDDVDAVLESNMEPTVLIGGFESNVPNRVDEQGMTLADRFAVLGQLSEFRVPALYLVEVTQLSNQLVKSGLLERKEASQITAAARNATVHR